MSVIYSEIYTCFKTRRIEANVQIAYYSIGDLAYTPQTNYMIPFNTHHHWCGRLTMFPDNNEFIIFEFVNGFFICAIDDVISLKVPISIQEGLDITTAQTVLTSVLNNFRELFDLEWMAFTGYTPLVIGNNINDQCHLCRNPLIADNDHQHHAIQDAVRQEQDQPMEVILNLPPVPPLEQEKLPSLPETSPQEEKEEEEEETTTDDEPATNSSPFSLKQETTTDEEPASKSPSPTHDAGTHDEPVVDDIISPGEEQQPPVNIGFTFQKIKSDPSAEDDLPLIRYQQRKANNGKSISTSLRGNIKKSSRRKCKKYPLLY